MKIKKGLALLLAFLLVLSNGLMVAANPVLEKQTDRQGMETKEKISKKEIEETYKKTDNVRVIVEVEGEPAITYATKQGKKFSELDKSKQAELQQKVMNSQNKVMAQMKDKKVKMEFKESFTTVFNGFSGVVKYGEIVNIEKLPGVSKVTISNEYERPVEKPEMKYSKELVEAQRAWDEYGYNGEGMIVGVIDSGVDASHKDFVLTNEEKVALSENDVNTFITEKSLPGKYYTAKVPYGYNYMDENDEIRDLGPKASEHGMHVAGTVGANGDEDNGGLKGVAPETQILALKVFGNDPGMGSTWGDIYIKAIDDAIILGADVINMSLGSTAAFVSPEDPEQQAVKKAVDNGVLMSISAGNSAHFGNGAANPYASNPDIGVVGAPGLSYDSLQVASFENSYMDLDAVTYSFEDDEGKAAFLSASKTHPTNVEQKSFEIEYAALGTPEDFAGKDFNGKYALVQRGEIAFTEKALNAQAAGASGVIIYNNADGFINMATEDTIVIPQLFMLKTDGDLLAEKLNDGVEVTVEFKGDKVTAANPLAGTMSSFTSWGVTPNLDFKPEITAPGGNILSTLQNDEYGVMSGTSMAAPHVSGGSAIVLQRVDEEFGLEGKARVELAKNILMNTAKKSEDKGTVQGMLDLDNPYSPRRQGAGLMQIHAALSTPVVVTEKNNGEAKVALKEVGDKIKFTLEANNFSDEDITYNLAANVQTDLSLFGELGFAPDELEAQELVDAKVTLNNGDETLIVPANGSVTFDVNIDVSDAKVLNSNGSALVNPDEVFPNGYFVEGFVTLTNETQPELSVPYVGFHGDWNKAPILDELAYDDHDSFYEQAGMLYDGGDSYYYLGYNPFTKQNEKDKIAISPNGDGEKDQIIPLLSYLRNAKTVAYNVLDENQNHLRTVKTENQIRKNYFDGGAGGAQTYRLNPSIYWDGTVKGDVVPDGKYYFEIKTTIDYPGKDAQALKVPVLVDTVAPTLESSLIGTILNFNGKDKTSGIAHYEIIIDGESQGIISGEKKSIDLKGLIDDDSEIAVIAQDHAGNATRKVIGADEDTSKPVIIVKTPDTFSTHSSSNVQVTGTVSDDSDIVEFKVEGKDVPLKWDQEKGHYLFDTTVTFEDGTHPIRISATDAKGNESSLSNSRTIYVDTTAPKLDVSGPSYVDSNVTEVDLVAHLKDNAEELRLLVDEDEVFYNEMPGYEMVPFKKDVTFKVNLEQGENVFTLELIDLADNKTTKEVKIYRAKDGEVRIDRVSGKDRYDTAVQVSQKGWDSSDVVVLARGDDYADALAGVPLAKKYDAPLLLTQSNKYTTVTKEEIGRLGAKTVYLLGGEAAIGKDVEKELKSQGVTVKRLKGSNRADTAVAIAKEVATNGKAKEVVLVNGYNFPDALSVASYAAENGMPILITQDEKLPAETKKAMSELGTMKTLVIGGEVAISSKVVKDVPNAERVAGKDRFATAVEVAKHFNVATNHYYVTTGMEFADALSSAALAAKEGTGVLIVGKKLPEAVSKFISDSKLDTLTIIGGPKAVNETVQKLLNDLLK